MPEDYFGDEAAPSEAPAATATDTETETEEKDQSTKTAVIDSSICPGMEAGDEMVLKIDKVMDGEYVVSYAPEPEEPEEEPGEGGYANAESADAMSPMMD